MAVSRRKTTTVIDIDDVAVTSLPTGDRHFTCGRYFNRCAPDRVNVLAFVIFMTTAGKRIAPATNSTFESSEHGPDGRYHAARTQKRFVHAHFAFELLGLGLEGCQRSCAVHRPRGSALSAGRGGFL